MAYFIVFTIREIVPLAGGMYLIKARKDVLAKYKYPHPLVRCDCEAVAKLIWMPTSVNEYVDDRCFFICQVPEKRGNVTL